MLGSVRRRQRAHSRCERLWCVPALLLKPPDLFDLPPPHSPNSLLCCQTYSLKSSPTWRGRSGGSYWVVLLVDSGFQFCPSVFHHISIVCVCWGIKCDLCCGCYIDFFIVSLCLVWDSVYQLTQPAVNHLKNTMKMIRCHKLLVFRHQGEKSRGAASRRRSVIGR